MVQKWFEYHCYEGEDSADAKLWHRTHQQVTVLRPLTEDEADQEVSMFKIRFTDGLEADVFADELFEDQASFTRRNYK